MNTADKIHKFSPYFAVVVASLFYWKVFLGFFQQDEWLAFSRHILLNNMDAKYFLTNALVPYSTHYTPLTVLTINLLFSLFKLSYHGYAIVSVGLHIVTVILVFYFAKLLIKNDFFALASAILFGISAAGYQATAWVVADIATHGATIFGLISLISFSVFLSSKKGLWFYLCLVSLIISLLFKEITIGLFVIIPIIFYLFADKNLKYKIRFPLIFFGILIFYLAFRVMLFADYQVNLTSADEINKNYLLYNAVLFPVKTVAQTVIPSGQILQFSYWFTSRLPEDISGEKGTTAFDIFAQENILRTVEFLLFLFITLGAFSLWKKSKDANFRKILLVSFLFIIINSVVYLLSPERTGTVSIIDSRNLYFPSIGTSIFIIAIFMKVTKGNLKKAFLLLLPILFINIFWLNYELNTLLQAGSLRREILTQFKNTYPNLPEKTVFYTTSDTSYYGLPPEEKIMPFQSGFGQTLLVWYHQTEKWPNGFFENRFLWEITEQGYREYDGRGFGYFRNKERLRKAVNDYSLREESVISFSWDNKYNALVDTTEELRKELRENK